MQGIDAPASACHPLIISGAPRSGTSLLYNLFDGHSEIAWLVDEGFLFEHLDQFAGGAIRVFLEAVPQDVDALIAGLRDKQLMPPLHLAYRQSKDRGTVSEVEIEAPWDEKAFRAALQEPRGDGVADLWRWLATACLAGMAAPRRRYACMKAPDYGHSAAAALDHVPEARGVVIVRDPLFAIDSLKRSRELRAQKLLSWPRFARTIRSFQTMLDRLRAADRARLFTVRYETLITAPKHTMAEIADWLEIAFEPCLLEPTMRGQPWPGISSFQATEGIEARAADRPIEALTAMEQDLVRRHLAEFRTAFGYA